MSHAGRIENRFAAGYDLLPHRPRADDIDRDARLLDRLGPSELHDFRVQRISAVVRGPGTHGDCGRRVVWRLLRRLLSLRQLRIADHALLHAVLLAPAAWLALSLERGI